MMQILFWGSPLDFQLQQQQQQHCNSFASSIIMQDAAMAAEPILVQL
jgi:hypothetical protein